MLVLITKMRVKQIITTRIINYMPFLKFQYAKELLKQLGLTF